MEKTCFEKKLKNFLIRTLNKESPLLRLHEKGRCGAGRHWGKTSLRPRSRRAGRHWGNIPWAERREAGGQWGRTSLGQNSWGRTSWGRMLVGQDVVGQNLVGQDVAGAGGHGAEGSGAGSGSPIMILPNCQK